MRSPRYLQRRAAEPAFQIAHEIGAAGSVGRHGEIGALGRIETDAIAGHLELAAAGQIDAAERAVRERGRELGIRIEQRAVLIHAIAVGRHAQDEAAADRRR